MLALTIHRRFLLTALAFLLLTTSIHAEEPRGGSGGYGPWNGDNNDRNGCKPWWNGSGSNDDCDTDNDGDSSNVNNVGNADASQFGYQNDFAQTNTFITAHAVLACLVWVFLIPAGGVLLRLNLKSPWIVRIHALLQITSYTLYVVAAALGVYLVRTLSAGYGPNTLWDDPHTKLGIAILVLGFLQPVLGAVHHRIFKRMSVGYKAGREGGKKPGRTVWGYMHLWLGRGLIVLGMINGGLGLRLASRNPFVDADGRRGKIIAYGVGCGVMFLLYVVFVVRGEIRRRKDQKQAVKDRNADLSRGVLLMDAEGGARSGAGVGVLPTYEQSQESLRKEASTARYQ